MDCKFSTADCWLLTADRWMLISNYGWIVIRPLRSKTELKCQEFTRSFFSSLNLFLLWLEITYSSILEQNAYLRLAHACLFCIRGRDSALCPHRPRGKRICTFFLPLTKRWCLDPLQTWPSGAVCFSHFSWPIVVASVRWGPRFTGTSFLRTQLIGEMLFRLCWCLDTVLFPFQRCTISDIVTGESIQFRFLIAMD